MLMGMRRGRTSSLVFPSRVRQSRRGRPRVGPVPVSDDDDESWRVLVACFCVFAHAEIPCDCIGTYYYVYNYYCYKYFYDQYNVSMVESVCLYSRV
jgi:hypothetical protein